MRVIVRYAMRVPFVAWMTGILSLPEYRQVACLVSSNAPQTSVADRRNLGLLLREPYRIGSEELHRRIAARGHPEIRAPHGNVFEFLDPDGTQVSELARRAQIAKQSMAELVAHLERHGYVERVPDPADRRAK